MKTQYNTVKSVLEKKIDDADKKIPDTNWLLAKLEVFDLSYFCGKSYFDDDGVHYHLVSQLTFKYFKFLANKSTITEWKSRGFSH